VRNRSLLATFVATVILVFSGLYPATSATPTNVELKKRLAYCGSIPNGTSLTVVDTTRLFIFLPKELFPHLNLNVSSHEATAYPAHNEGSDGYAQSPDAKPGCWSHYFEFHLASGIGRPSAGVIDIGSKNGFKTVSNYLIHFRVVVNPPSATKQLPGNGNVVGHVVLGPVCPVERIPPDPACAPRPYKTTMNIWSKWTGSSYQPVPTDANGIVKLSLPPGAYSMAVSLAANGSPFPRCSVVKISVLAKKTQNVTVNCDTGIR
jgi:hypothetical protein